MINCNPETVSTDYDTVDRLFFEPLTFEDVMGDPRHASAANGAEVSVVVQFGGQTPLKLALALQAAGVKIIGTSPDSIDLAEDRERFAKLLNELDIPSAGERHGDVARTRRGRWRPRSAIRWWCVRRYVLGGRAMAIVYDPASLERYMTSAVDASPERPILIDQLPRRRVRAGRRRVGRRAGDVVIGGVMEHIEEAGIHSGDSSCVVPPYPRRAAAPADDPTKPRGESRVR